MQLGEGSSPQVSLCVCLNPTFSSHISLFFPFSLPLRLLQRVEAVSHVAWSSSEDVRWSDRDCPQCRDTRNACGLIGEDGTEWGTGSSVGEKERSPGAELRGTRLLLLLSDKLFPALVHVFLTQTTCLWNN